MFSRWRDEYVVELDHFVDEGVNFISDLRLIGGCEIADAGNSWFEDNLLIDVVESCLNILPEIFDQAAVIGQEEGQSWDQIVPITIDWLDIGVVVDN